MTESFERIVSPEMAKLIEEGNWTAVEILEREDLEAREAAVAPLGKLASPSVVEMLEVEPFEETGHDDIRELFE